MTHYKIIVLDLIFTYKHLIILLFATITNIHLLHVLTTFTKINRIIYIGNMNIVNEYIEYSIIRMEKKRFFECSKKHIRKFKVRVQCRKSNSLKEDAIQSDQIFAV